MSNLIRRLSQPGSFSGYGLILTALTVFLSLPEESVSQLTYTAAGVMDSLGPFLVAVIGVGKIIMDDNAWL